MSCKQFEAILSAICYTNHQPPVFVDCFCKVKQLIDAWNNDMTKKFLPRWINAINESMLKWVSEYTCPGLMFVPRKPWPFGNEYHNNGCANSDIMWQVDLHEGNDWTAGLGPRECDDNGKICVHYLHYFS